MTTAAAVKGEEPGLHVHVGAGGIGLACVLPLLKSLNRRILVVNRVGDRFEQNTKAGGAWLECRANQPDAARMTVSVTFPSHDASTVQERFSLYVPVQGATLSQEQIKRCSDDLRDRDVYVLTNDLTQLADLIGQATSLSSALHDVGQVDLLNTLKSLPSVKPRPIYLFENRNQFAKEPGAWAEQVVHVLIDCICVQKESTYRDGELVEEVARERRAKLWSTTVLPPGVEVWNDKRSHELYEWNQIDRGHHAFYEKKKRYLVNSVHTVVTMLGYQRLATKGIRSEIHSRQMLSLVLDGVLGEPHTRRVIEVFAAARVVQLLLEVPSARPASYVDDATAYAELVSEVGEVVVRIRDFPDEMSRVLEKGDRDKIFDRWKQHVGDLRLSVRVRRQEFLRFPARERPHVREIDAALDYLADVVRELVIPGR